MPISVTSTAVSGSSLQTVRGRPISLFWLASAQIVGVAALQSAPRMSFVEVFPVDPTTATTRASLFERTSDASAASAASWSSGTSVLAPRDAALGNVRDTGVQRHEEIAGADECASRP